MQAARNEDNLEAEAISDIQTCFEFTAAVENKPLERRYYLKFSDFLPAKTPFIFGQLSIWGISNAEEMTHMTGNLRTRPTLQPHFWGVLIRMGIKAANCTKPIA